MEGPAYVVFLVYLTYVILPALGLLLYFRKDSKKLDKDLEDLKKENQKAEEDFVKQVKKQ